jgi:prepilin peptidase CpaA
MAGVAAIAFAVWHGAARRMLANTRQVLVNLAWSAIGGQRPAVHLAPGQSVGKLAYGISIAFATIGYIVARQLGFI